MNFLKYFIKKMGINHKIIKKNNGIRKRNRIIKRRLIKYAKI